MTKDLLDIPLKDLEDLINNIPFQGSTLGGSEPVLRAPNLKVKDRRSFSYTTNGIIIPPVSRQFMLGVGNGVNPYEGEPYFLGYVDATANAIPPGVVAGEITEFRGTVAQLNGGVIIQQVSWFKNYYAGATGTFRLVADVQPPHPIIFQSFDMFNGSAGGSIDTSFNFIGIQIFIM